ncbi:MAG: hypothetical protein QW041_00855 [Candidatus Pacearchaeota archaeon]
MKFIILFLTAYFLLKEPSTLTRILNLNITLIVFSFIFILIIGFIKFKKQNCINYFQKKKETIIGLILLMSTIILFFAVSEIALRIIFHGPERVIGVIPMIREYQKYFNRINNNRMRDIDYTLEKPENVIRVAVIGDSFAKICS